MSQRPPSAKRLTPSTSWYTEDMEEYFDRNVLEPRVHAEMPEARRPRMRSTAPEFFSVMPPSSVSSFLSQKDARALSAASKTLKSAVAPDLSRRSSFSRDLFIFLRKCFSFMQKLEQRLEAKYAGEIAGLSPSIVTSTIQTSVHVVSSDDNILATAGVLYIDDEDTVHEKFVLRFFDYTDWEEYTDVVSMDAKYVFDAGFFKHVLNTNEASQQFFKPFLDVMKNNTLKIETVMSWSTTWNLETGNPLATHDPRVDRLAAEETFEDELTEFHTLRFVWNWNSDLDKFEPVEIVHERHKTSASPPDEHLPWNADPFRNVYASASTGGRVSRKAKK